MLAKFTDSCWDIVLINPEHIAYVIQPEDARNARNIGVYYGATGTLIIPVKETMDEILNIVNNTLNHGEKE